MNLGAIVFYLSLPWVTIYASYFALRWCSASSRLSLPAPVSTGGRRRGSRASSTQVSLELFHLRVQTKEWNTLFDTLSNRLKSRRLSRLHSLLTKFYNVGCVFGILGMLGAFGLLLWNCIQTIVSLSGTLGAPTHVWNSTNGLTKRVLETYSAVPMDSRKASARSDTLITAIIPGITVPFAHLPAILAAVFFGQIIHEAGHAICATLEAIPVTSTGASFYIYIPSAFVTLPATFMDTLLPLARLRIIAAGPFHNAVFWCFLTVAAWSGIGNILWSAIGYRDISAIGKVVLNVDRDSPLYGFLQPGSLIVKLDDTPIGMSRLSGDIWTSYLTNPQHLHSKASLGWCVSKGLMAAQTCCLQPGDHKNASLSCFTSSEVPTKMYCVDPVPVLTNAETGVNTRCTYSTDCTESFVCTQPHNAEQLLRMTVHDPPWLQEGNQGKVILWSGPKSEVWDQVTVGALMPRFAFLPTALPSFVGVLFE